MDLNLIIILRWAFLVIVEIDGTNLQLHIQLHYVKACVKKWF